MEDEELFNEPEEEDFNDKNVVDLEAGEDDDEIFDEFGEEGQYSDDY